MVFTLKFPITRQRTTRGTDQSVHPTRICPCSAIGPLPGATFRSFVRPSRRSDTLPLPSPTLLFFSLHQMDEVCLNSEPVYEDEVEEFEIEGDCEMTEYVGQSGVIQGKNPLPPAVGMEFESYEDVYYFYNCYAKQQGFGVRVSNTWYRKSKERYRGKLSCSSAGFKKKSEANRPRPETRTGCPAMIKFRLMENKRWRIIEVELEHNHLISAASGKFYKSHKNMSLGTKRPLHVDDPEEVQKIRLFRTVIIDSEDNGSLYTEQREVRSGVDQTNQLSLKQGDAQAIYNFFSHSQLLNPNFFYVMDLNERGHLRNVFWADPRCRAVYGYFGDVVAIDTKYLVEKYEVPLVVLTGVNHHGQSVPLGCGLVAGGTLESFTWLFRAWLTYMLGRPPQAIISDQCKSLQAALSDVFPRAFSCISLSYIMSKVPKELGDLLDYEAIKPALTRAVYHSLRPEEYEVAWEEMMQHYRIRDHKWLQTLYEDRKRWVPAYLKDTFLAGMFPLEQIEGPASVFEGYLHKHTPLKEFIDNYMQSLHEIHQKEIFADLESTNSGSVLKSSSYFELQLSKLYTENIFKRFQGEVEGMHSCFSKRLIHIDGSIITYIVKEHVEVEESRGETREFEVLYNASEAGVVCVCGLFNFEGYLCRHALNVLNQNGIEEIPPQYILSRWRKDIQRNYVADHGCPGIDINNPVHRYDHLYRCAVQVVEEGRKSHDHYKFALQALDEILSKVHLVGDHSGSS